MSNVGPWLVVGGAALVVLCAVAVMALALRLLRRGRPRVEESPDARVELRDAVSRGPADEDELMPLLLRAATEAARAEAAVVTFTRKGAGRRSFATGLDVEEARAAIGELGALHPTEPTHGEAASPLGASFVLPLEHPGVDGVVGLYWRDGEARRFDLGELMQLVADAFAHSRPAAAEPPPTPRPSADRTGMERWTRLAELNAAIEPGDLLRKLVDAALAEGAADAAAARLRAPEGQEADEIRHFAGHERQWVESVLGPEAVVPSITRYVTAPSDAAADGEAPIATAIVVPLRGTADEPLGSLVAVWRRDLADDGDGMLAALEALVTDARAAVANASRFHRLRSIAARDPLTGLLDQRFFFDRLAECVDHADRTSRPLVLLLFAASAIEPAGGLEVSEIEDALAHGATAIATAVGERGVAGRVGLGDFAAILENTGLVAAERLLAELARELPARAGSEARVSWSARAVLRRESEQAAELWQRARRELHPHRDSPAATSTSTSTTAGSMHLSLGNGAEG